MGRLSKGLAAHTRANKIKRLEKHVKFHTRTKVESKQVGGRLVAEPVTRYRGGQQALSKLAQLKAL